MLSGAPLLLVIVVGWAAVLVPMLLRRHDVSVESRSADRFASAMRILSRRSVPTADRRYVVVPRPPGPARGRLPVEPRDALGAPAPAGRPGRIGARPAASHPRPGRAQLVVRRRRLLLGLATIAVGGLVGGLAVAPDWWWVNAAADLLVVGFVIHLRREAIRARARARRRLGPPFAAPLVDRRPAAQAPPAPAVDEGPALVVAETTAARTVEVTTYNREAGWQPVPVPVPTYVTAPRAPERSPDTTAGPAQPRIVDLTRPGAWSAAELGIDLAGEDDPFVAELSAGEDRALDDILERRRAVND